MCSKHLINGICWCYNHKTLKWTFYILSIMVESWMYAGGKLKCVIIFHDMGSPGLQLRLWNHDQVVFLLHVPQCLHL